MNLQRCSRIASLFYLKVPKGFKMPWWMGLYRWDYGTCHAICLPLGVNYIAACLHWLWRKVAIPPFKDDSKEAELLQKIRRLEHQKNSIEIELKAYHKICEAHWKKLPEDERAGAERRWTLFIQSLSRDLTP